MSPDTQTFEIPRPLKVEHEELHAQLARATKEAGEVGAAAREVARILHPHFVSEEEFALPPLGLLRSLAAGTIDSNMKPAIAMTRRLKSELPRMLEEHRRLSKLCTRSSRRRRDVTVLRSRPSRRSSHFTRRRKKRCSIRPRFSWANSWRHNSEE